MKSLKHGHSARLGAFISAFIALIALAVFLVIGHASAFAVDDQQSGRLVTIHDRGVDTVIVTKGDTVGDALKQANIAVDSNDAVEPAVTEKLIGKDYSINIYRARPVIVVDGETRQKIITPYQTAEQITKSVGITLYPEDKTTLTRTDDIVAEGAGLQLTITRATPFNFTLYGATTLARTQAKTVGDMLKEKGITLGRDDRVSLDLSTPMTANMAIRVWREGKQTITVSEDINFDVQTIQDGDQYVGYHAIQTPGVNGSRNVTYEVTIEDGKEVSRTEIASITTKAPQQQIDVIGAKYISGDISGEKQQYMSEAGIAASDYNYVDYIVSHESGWCATKWQGQIGGCPSYHGTPDSAYVGYGLCQATPGYKMVSAGGDWGTNPITQLTWCNNYAQRTYGGWSGAYSHWLASHNW